jgi:beta-lactamase class A
MMGAIKLVPFGLLLFAGPATAQTLQADVAKMLDGLKAKSSIYAKHIPSGKTIDVRGDLPMNTLSVIKLPVMIQVFRDVEAGRLKLTDRYLVRPEDLRAGSGLIQTFDPGLNPTIRDLVEQMIITSDNTATDILIKKVGVDRVNETLAKFGFKQTRLKFTTGDLFREVWVRADPKNAAMTDREVFTRGFPRDAAGSARSFTLEGDSTKWLGRTTAREMVELLEGIQNAKYTDKQHSQMMVDMLLSQFYSSRLPQRLAWQPGVSIGHKTGDWPPFAGNDVGIIFYPGGPLIVAVFTNQNTGDFFELEATEGRIAERLVRDWK